MLAHTGRRPTHMDTVNKVWDSFSRTVAVVTIILMLEQHSVMNQNEMLF